MNILEHVNKLDQITYELNLMLSQWECNTNLKADGITYFKKGRTYKRVPGLHNLVLIDETGSEHTLGKWTKHFYNKHIH